MSPGRCRGGVSGSGVSGCGVSGSGAGAASPGPVPGVAWKGDGPEPPGAREAAHGVLAVDHPHPHAVGRLGPQPGEREACAPGPLHAGVAPVGPGGVAEPEELGPAGPGPRERELRRGLVEGAQVAGRRDRVLLAGVRGGLGRHGQGRAEYWGEGREQSEEGRHHHHMAPGGSGGHGGTVRERQGPRGRTAELVALVWCSAAGPGSRRGVVASGSSTSPVGAPRHALTPSLGVPGPIIRRPATRFRVSGSGPATPRGPRRPRRRGSARRAAPRRSARPRASRGSAPGRPARRQLGCRRPPAPAS